MNVSSFTGIALVSCCIACSEDQQSPTLDLSTTDDCEVVDPVLPCACQSFLWDNIGDPCSPVGATCLVIYDAPPFQGFQQYTISCGADGHKQCQSGSCFYHYPDLAVPVPNVTMDFAVVDGL
jgi:hypothetical protein